MNKLIFSLFIKMKGDYKFLHQLMREAMPLLDLESNSWEKNSKPINSLALSWRNQRDYYIQIRMFDLSYKEIRVKASELDVNEERTVLKMNSPYCFTYSTDNVFVVDYNDGKTLKSYISDAYHAINKKQDVNTATYHQKLDHIIGIINELNQ